MPSPSDWAKCEHELGRELPADFKTIINTSGALALGSCWLRNPIAPPIAELSRAALIREYLIFGEIAKEMLNIDFFPELGGWIEVAYMDRVLFMLKPTGDEIVIVHLGVWEVFETASSFSDLIWSIYNDRSLYGGLGESIWHRKNGLFG